MKINEPKINSLSNNLNQVDKKEKKQEERISSGKKINSAADDAAGLAMAEKMTALINGIGKGINNTYDMQNAIKTADGALSGISDGLKRIRELGVQASSGILSKDDKALIQEEINQTLQGINDIAKNTQFNGQNLLDGSFKDKQVAMNSNGSGTTVSIGAASTDALGISGFDVTGDSIDFSALDKAIDSVSTARTKIGAQINRFDHAIGSNTTTALNQLASRSKIEDADIAKESMDMQKNQALSQYGIFAQKNEAQTQYNMLNVLF